MSLGKLKDGKEFVCYWFEEGKAGVFRCKWDDESFWIYLRGEWKYVDEEFFKHTTIVSQ